MTTRFFQEHARGVKMHYRLKSKIFAATTVPQGVCLQAVGDDLCEECVKIAEFPMDYSPTYDLVL